MGRAVNGKVAIVQFDDRPDDMLGVLAPLVARNAAYARAHGSAHFFLRDHPNEIPMYWHKVALLESCLSEFEYVAWLDTDAVVHDFELSIAGLFTGPEMMVFAGDIPVWGTPQPFNAGVFFCRGAQARALMGEWRALYPAHLWRKEDGRWNFTDHVWAGEAYEQGAFIRDLLPRYAGTGALRILPWRELQSPCPLPESRTLHFTNVFRPNALLHPHIVAGR